MSIIPIFDQSAHSDPDFYVPTCDGEGCTVEINKMLTTAEEAQREMDAAGWVTDFSSESDFCPECAIKRHIGEKE